MILRRKGRKEEREEERMWMKSRKEGRKKNKEKDRKTKEGGKKERDVENGKPKIENE